MIKIPKYNQYEVIEIISHLVLLSVSLKVSGKEMFFENQEEGGLFRGSS